MPFQPIFDARVSILHGISLPWFESGASSQLSPTPLLFESSCSGWAMSGSYQWIRDPVFVSVNWRTTRIAVLVFVAIDLARVANSRASCRRRAQTKWQFEEDVGGTRSRKCCSTCREQASLEFA